MAPGPSSEASSGGLKTPTWSNVINSPLDQMNPNEDNSSKLKSGGIDLDDHLKIIDSMGRPTSTMDPAYDAKRPDETWICVFCKRGTHVLVRKEIKV